jgi:hypothetical protein
MELALGAGQPEAAQLVAAECVVEAETKDHQNWELIGLLADKLTGREAKALKAAHAEVEDQEDEHLCHTMGWGAGAVDRVAGSAGSAASSGEEKSVKTAIGAARAKLARETML